MKTLSGNTPSKFTFLSLFYNEIAVDVDISSKYKYIVGMSALILF